MAEIRVYKVEGENEPFLRLSETISMQYSTQSKSDIHEVYKVIDATLIFLKKIEGNIIVTGENVDQIKETKEYLEDLVNVELVSY